MPEPLLAQLAPVLESRLHGLVARLDVPGAVVGISHNGERVITAAGVAGLRNPQPVTADTAFQLGSISKVYTATLLLGVGGAAILGRRVAELVPEAHWMQPEITVGHLLTHSSGLGGDHFADTGRGDDALARYVSELEALPRDVPGPPGVRYSYCNSGFAVLGRLIEVLTGTTYDEALRTHLLDPLQAHATSTLAEDTILGPVALGHNRHDPGALQADDRWNFARSGGPLGGISATADDVLSFAELHLSPQPPLDPAVAALMRERHLAAPPLSRPNARGLGWGIYDWDGGRLVGHDGETLGQIASLRLVPEHRLAVVALTNAIPDGSEITSELLARALEPWGLTPRVLARSPRGRDFDFDPSPYVGAYRNLQGTSRVQGDDAGLTVTTHYTTEGLEEDTEITRLVPLGDGAFVDDSVEAPTRAVRFEDLGSDGRMHSYFTGRIAWRVLDDS